MFLFLLSVFVLSLLDYCIICNRTTYDRITDDLQQELFLRQ